jgi:Tol biopolymer transport system component
MIKNRPLLFLALILLILLSFSCKEKQKQKSVLSQSSDWKYLGQAEPGKNPTLFSPEFISTKYNERDITISPSGHEIFYSMVLPENNLSVILYVYFDGAFWSDPQVAGFSGQYNDLEPSFSPDGEKLFFASKRPLKASDDEKDFDIWVSEKTTMGWTAASNIGSPVNTKENEYYPSIASNGNIYFTAAKEDSRGKEDLYVSHFVNGNYLPPRNLGDSINTALFEYNAYIAPDESFIIFGSFGREDGLGGGDLYIAKKNDEGFWLPAKNMGPVINTDELDYCPFVTSDKKYFLFTSNRSNPLITSGSRKSYKLLIDLTESIENGLGNIYWAKFDTYK